MKFEARLLGWPVTRRAIVPGASKLEIRFHNRPEFDTFQVS